jgi:hypothetical protein
MIPGCLDGMTRAEAWRNEYAIRRLAEIEHDSAEGTGRDRGADELETAWADRATDGGSHYAEHDDFRIRKSEK